MPPLPEIFNDIRVPELLMLGYIVRDSITATTPKQICDDTFDSHGVLAQISA
jgi:hypothetical protein